jgi:hypothetical protein
MRGTAARAAKTAATLARGASAAARAARAEVGKVARAVRRLRGGSPRGLMSGDAPALPVAALCLLPGPAAPVWADRWLGRSGEP